MAERLVLVVQAKGAEALAAEIERVEADKQGNKVFAITEARDGGFTAFLRHVNR